MAHIHEKLDFTVEAFIVNKDRVLLRMHEKYGLWLPPGGHIDLGQDPVEAVVREAKEEVGLDIILQGEVPESKMGSDRRMVLPPRFMDRHPINETHEHLVMYYFAISESDKVSPRTEEDRSDEWKWFTAEELYDPEYGVMESIRFIASEALRELGGK